MPEDSKKPHEKKKNDPKEQRRPRQRHQQATVDKKVQKKADETKSVPPVTQKPIYESPPPEFFKNLKRETDEILKITEEENAKYKKKEIRSNWTKYEMPIDTYEEIEEHENMGADYEKLVQASHSIGGHFQFKHEKSWDINTGPSVYDKYFEINMDDLYLSLCTIPFYERNTIDESLFSQADILNMNKRIIRYKQKYFNDNLFSTGVIEAQDTNEEKPADEKTDEDKVITKDLDVNTNYDTDNISIKHEVKKITPIGTEVNNFTTNVDLVHKESRPPNSPSSQTEGNNDTNKENKTNVSQHVSLKENIDKSCTENVGSMVVDTILKENPKVSDDKIMDEPEDDDFIFGNTKHALLEQPTEITNVVQKVIPTATDKAEQETKNPVIESPEDLEKWLDDFLDG